MMKARIADANQQPQRGLQNSLSNAQQRLRRESSCETWRLLEPESASQI